MSPFLFPSLVRTDELDVYPAKVVACDGAPELVGRYVVSINAKWCPTWSASESGPLRCPLHVGHWGQCWGATPELISSLLGPLAVLAAQADAVQTNVPPVPHATTCDDG